MDINTFINHLVSEFEVQSILCYGSQAQKLHDNESDIDLLVIMKNSFPSSIERQGCYNKFSNLHITSLDVNHADDWDNSWSPVNDGLILEKQRIDIGYNTSSWVTNVIQNLIIKHQITFKEFPFRPYTFLGLLECSKILYDENDFIKKCRAQIRPFPLELKREIIHSFLPILKECHADLVDYSKRNIGILAYQFQLFRGIDAAIGILFAINEVYDPASKRTEPFLFKLKKQPPNLSKFITHILPRFYENQHETNQFFEECIKWVGDYIE